MDEQIVIDMSTVYDDIDGRQIEFSGVVEGEEYNFALQYSVLEALTGEAPQDDAVGRFAQSIDTIRIAALSALARDIDLPVVVVTESDLVE